MAVPSNFEKKPCNCLCCSLCRVAWVASNALFTHPPSPPGPPLAPDGDGDGDGRALARSRARASTAYTYGKRFGSLPYSVYASVPWVGCVLGSPSNTHPPSHPHTRFHPREHVLLTPVRSLSFEVGYLRTHPPAQPAIHPPPRSPGRCPRRHTASAPQRPPSALPGAHGRTEP